MPQNNCDPILLDAAAGDHPCPKCGTQMEPIDAEVEGLSLPELELCPGCYLVTWTDEEGPHVRQGVPIKADGNSGSESRPIGPGWSAREPEKC